MKILCLCLGGNVRSVCVSHHLRAHHGHDTIPYGTEDGKYSTAKTRDFLAEWADRIVVVEPHFSKKVPVQHQHKVIVLEVGPDKWGAPYHPELRAIVERETHKHHELMQRGEIGE